MEISERGVLDAGATLSSPSSSSSSSAAAATASVDVRLKKSVSSSPSFVVDYVSGAAGGVAVVLVGHPFDVREKFDFTPRYLAPS